MSKRARIYVCTDKELENGQYRRVDVLYAGEPSSVLVFRLNDTYHAFRNLCVHMPRTLDCEAETVFDECGQHLRCSMHGITYDPASGEALSPICEGRKLTPVKFIVEPDGIWLYDKRVAPALNHP